jgi:gliding motility-associated-like protein
MAVPAPIVYDACNDTVKGLTSKNITINPVPKITATPDSLVICSGNPISVKISSCVSGTLINWVGSNKTSGNDSNLTDSPKDTISVPIGVNYTVYSSYKGCPGDTDHVYVKVNPSPTVTVSHDTTILQGSSVGLIATTNGVSYNWSPPDGLSCTTCPNPIAAPNVSTTYVVTVTSSDGCSKTDTVIVDVTPQAISIPNIFTPNGDKKNDVFYIHNLEYYPGSHLVIYDRWGKKVYESASYPNNWDGGDQSDGVYYYVLTLPNSRKYDGYVQILR